MIQRYVYEALRRGLAAYKADPTLYDRLFGDLYDFQAAEILAIKKRFADYEPTLMHAFTPVAPRMPVYLISTESEQQPNFALNDYGGAAAYGVGAAGQPVVAQANITSIWQHNVSVCCMARESETVLYMYEVLKSVLLAAKPYFQSNRLDIVTMAGTDLSRDGQKEDFIFMRNLTFRCQREFAQADINSTLYRAFKVAGMERPTNAAPIGRLQLAKTIFTEEG